MLTDRQLFLNHLAQTSAEPLMLEITRADGVYLYGPCGEKYTDLISGVSVSNTGHRHPAVIEAIREQTEKYLHLMVYGELVQNPQVSYAAYLTSFLPETLGSVYFVNSGSEAVEGALKLAKRFTGRSRLIYFENAYHGSTHGAMSVQGSEFFRNAYRPLLPDTLCLRFNNTGDLEKIDEHSACVIVEPVQSEAGVIEPEGSFLKELRDRCTQTGSLLIFDEAQTGLGRTGSMFAFEKYKVVPDILVLAKALGGGMPLGAFIASQKIMSCLVSRPHLGHITTFGGHPVCCAAGLASMKIISGEKLHGQAIVKESLFREKLKHPVIREVRGSGLLLAVELAGSDLVKYVISNAPRHGLLLDYFLFCETAFRIAPPLTIRTDEIEDACTKLNDLLDEAAKLK
jgi:acetylornithine/succinyldiaminopimelate/putrescine aminotransferase